MRTIRIMIACAIAASIVNAQTPPTDPKASPTPTPTPSPAPKGLAVEWRQEIAPAAADDRNAVPWIVAGQPYVLITGAGLGLTAHDVKDGHVAWSFETPSAVPPVIAGDHVAVVAEGTVLALDQRTGQVAWRASFEGKPQATFGSGDRVGVVFDKSIQWWDAAGKPGQKIDTVGALTTPVCSTGELLLFGTDEPALAAVEAASGTLKWKVTLPTTPSSLVATSDRAYFSGEDGHLYSYRITGAVKQEWDQTRIRAIGQPLVDTRFAYFALLDNSVRAFGADGGTQQWDRVVDTRPVAGPFRVGDNVAVALVNGQVVELSAKDGKPVSPSKDPTVTRLRLLGVAVSADATRVYTITIAGDMSRTLAAWTRSSEPPSRTPSAARPPQPRRAE